MNNFYPVSRIGKRACDLPKCSNKNIGIDNRTNWYAYQNNQHECRDQTSCTTKPEVFQRELLVRVLNVLKIAIRNQKARNNEEQVNANITTYKLVG